MLFRSGNCNIIKIEVFDQRLFSEKYIGEAVIDCERIPSGDHRFLIPLTSYGKQDPSLGGIRVNICLQRCCKCSYPPTQCNPCYQVLPNVPISMCPVLQCAVVDPPPGTLLRNNMNLIRRSSSQSCSSQKKEYPRDQPVLRSKPMFPCPGEFVGRKASMSVKCYPLCPPSSSRN